MVSLDRYNSDDNRRDGTSDVLNRRSGSSIPKEGNELGEDGPITRDGACTGATNAGRRTEDKKKREKKKENEKQKK